MKKINGKISLEEYIKNIESQSFRILDNANRTLVMVDSLNRGQVLYNIIDDVWKAHSYYLLYKWWRMINVKQNLFTAPMIELWIDDAGIYLDLSELDFDINEFITVFRGENKFSNTYEKGALSWSTSQEVAESFAHGKRFRTGEAPKPIIIVGKVHRTDILGKFDDRDEFELLCRNVVIEKKISLEKSQLVA